MTSKILPLDFKLFGNDYHTLISGEQVLVIYTNPSRFFRKIPLTYKPYIVKSVLLSEGRVIDKFIGRCPMNPALNDPDLDWKYDDSPELQEDIPENYASYEAMLKGFVQFLENKHFTSIVYACDVYCGIQLFNDIRQNSLDFYYPEVPQMDFKTFTANTSFEHHDLAPLLRDLHMDIYTEQLPEYDSYAECYSVGFAYLTVTALEELDKLRGVLLVQCASNGTPLPSPDATYDELVDLLE